MKAAASPDVNEEFFYIPATEAPSRPRRVLKQGDTFAIVDNYGDIGVSRGGPDGIFHADTRHLSLLDLRFNGMQPLLLGSSLRTDNSTLAIDLTNPDIFVGDSVAIPKDTIHIERTLFLFNGCAYQRLGLQNFGQTRIKFRLSLAFDSDFADVFEVRGIHRGRRGKTQARVDSSGHLVFGYAGLDGHARGSSLTFQPEPARIQDRIAHYVLDLEAGDRYAIYITLDCNHKTAARPKSFFHSMIAARREMKAATRKAAGLVTSDSRLNEVLCRSMSDLYMLITETPQGPYPYAGIPWYSTTFGRDGILTALQMLWIDPTMAKGVLRRLAALQASAIDAQRDAEPGKILHEMRSGEMAVLGEVPFALYYGSVDSTPLFVLLLGSYFERTGDLDTLRELWPNAELALQWIDTYGDRDSDGFIEYQRATETGLLNQGWKDSQDSIFHQDGRLAEGPIALAEAQGYVYAAKQIAARCARRLGRIELSDQLVRQSVELRNRFDEAFWSDELGTYATALDGDKKACLVRASNAGQVLFSGIALPEKAALVGKILMGPSFFSGWGIRTVAHHEARYNPMSYHNGSVWPHDNAMIAGGMNRYGFKRGVERIFAGMIDAASYMEFYRLPELFCGFHRASGRGPTLYPVACAPQAWSAAVPFSILQSMLGLEFDPDRREIRFYNPMLPSFVDTLNIRKLPVDDADVDLVVRNQGDTVSLEIIRDGRGVRVSAIYS